MTRTKEIGNKREYAKLLADVLPHVIRTEEENERYPLALETLLNNVIVRLRRAIFSNC